MGTTAVKLRRSGPSHGKASMQNDVTVPIQCINEDETDATRQPRREGTTSDRSGTARGWDMLREEGHPK
eukprot:scaffold220618_cov36-Tisochrysis_lutea.AAC.3